MGGVGGGVCGGLVGVVSRGISHTACMYSCSIGADEAALDGDRGGVCLTVTVTVARIECVVGGVYRGLQLGLFSALRSDVSHGRVACGCIARVGLGSIPANPKPWPGPGPGWW